MTNYKGIKGLTIQEVASDPPAPIEGQVWYNTTTSALKGYINSPGSWSTGGSLNTARRSIAGAGTQTAALGFGGYDGVPKPAPQYGRSDATELYNGTSWTSVNSLGSFVYDHDGSGSSTAALSHGGKAASPFSAVTESWNGTNWTTVNSLNTARQYLGGFGTTNTANIAYGGNTGTAPDASAIVESWNGTNWTEVNDLNTGRFRVSGGAGTSTAGLVVAGDNATPSKTQNVELWNGTNWTEVNNLPGNASFNTTAGTQTSAITFGGFSNYDFGGTDTATWNGTNWTTVGSMGTSNYNAGAGASSSAAAVGFGGAPIPVAGNMTEEFNSGLATKTLSTG